MQALRRITDLAIEAVVDDGALREMCGSLRTVFGARHHLLLEQAGEPIRAHVIDTTFSAQAIGKYVEHCSTADSRAEEAMRRPGAGRDADGHLLAVTERAGPQRLLSLSLVRTQAEGPFDSQHNIQFSRLAPTLGRLIRARATLRERMAENALGFRGLDAFARPILMVDVAGRVVFSNQAAQNLVQRSSASVSYAYRSAGRGDLALWFGHDGPRLALAIREVASGAAPGRQIALKADSASAARVVDVIRVRDRAPGAECNYAMLVLQSQMRRAPPSAEVLTQAFGLTAAEARVAVAIASGVTPQHYAQRQGLSSETVRSQIKCGFSKLGVNRQADLVRVVLAAAA